MYPHQAFHRSETHCKLLLPPVSPVGPKQINVLARRIGSVSSSVTKNIMFDTNSVANSVV